MNRELLEEHWTEIKDSLKERFDHLTEEDINQINGRFEQLVTKLEQRYGYTRQEAEEELKRWIAPPSPVPTDRPSEQRIDIERRKRGGDSPFFKWLLLFCIPLLLLFTYFAKDNIKEPNMNGVYVNTETPADQAMSRGIRDSLAKIDPFRSDLATLNIVSANGVVTLSGTVKSADTRDQIVKAVQGLSGVTQVIDQIEVAP